MGGSTCLNCAIDLISLLHASDVEFNAVRSGRCVSDLWVEAECAGHKVLRGLCIMIRAHAIRVIESLGIEQAPA